MKSSLTVRDRRRAMGLVFVSCCGLLTALSQASCADERQIASEVSFESIFDPPPTSGIPDRFRGALLMRWDRKRFREFSGLQALDGDRMAAVSDRGALLQFTLVVEEGRLVGASQPRLSRLLGVTGKELKRKDGDAESLTSDRQGNLIVAFEKRPRLLLYRPPFTGTPQAFGMPDAIASFPKNRGIEASTWLCDGQLLILAQGARADDANAWVGGAQGWTAIRYVRADGYSPTGATTLRDCSVLVLERHKATDDRYDIRIRRLDAASLRALNALQPALYLGPLISRNHKFEGITVSRHSPEVDLLYLISDSKPETGTVLVAFSIATGHGKLPAMP